MQQYGGNVFKQNCTATGELPDHGQPPARVTAQRSSVLLLQVQTHSASECQH